MLEELEVQEKILKEKMIDEIENNEIKLSNCHGQTVIYDQEIQLRHLYSNCLLTLNVETLAKQNGCVEVYF